jgi:hypothetical protein
MVIARRAVAWAVLLAALSCVAVLSVAGCGNVYLQADSLTAAETSTLDAWQAAQRATADPAVPEWEKAYLDENFKQWRCFVRSARKDLAWGPKLSGE